MEGSGEGGRGAGEKGSTHFHHLYTRRENGGGGGGGYLVDISVFPIPGVSALFHQFSSPLAPSSACLLPLTKQPDGLSPLYFRTGLNHRRGFPAVFAADEKGSGLYLARRTLPPLPRLFLPSGDSVNSVVELRRQRCARAVAELAERATCLTALGRSVINPSHLSASLSIRSEDEEGRCVITCSPNPPCL